MRLFHIYVGVFSIALFSACSKNIESDVQSPDKEENGQMIQKEAATEAEPGTRYVANELLVKFKSGAGERLRTDALARINGTVTERVLTPAMQNLGDNEGFFVVRTNRKVMDALGEMRSMSNVEYAEPNYIYHHEATSNDTYFTNGSLWGMYGDAGTPKNQYGSQASEAWAAGHTGAASVVVGIIDEGAKYNHTDLSGNIKNPAEFNGVTGVDDDGNGFVDDRYGWNFVSNNNATSATADDHGTHVAGTIGAKGGNGAGVAGVNWAISMISGKFLGASGGTTANAVKAVDYFTNLKTKNGYNLVATNNSWGGGGYSQALYDAISRANTRGILFIAAAGNGGSDGVGDNNNTTANYPSNYALPNVIAVASITSTGALSSFSNYGSTTVHIGAPGSAIYSTLPSSSGGSTYGSYNGTSMATPHVTGAAALYASTHPGATAAQIKAAILNSGIATSSLSGKTITGKRLNVSGF